MTVQVDEGLPGSATVQVEGGTTVEMETTAIYVEVTGAEAPQPNIWVGDTQPTFTSTGIWVETGLGPDGDDFTIWIEDGQ